MAFLNSGSPFIDGKQRNRRTCPGSHSLDLRTQRLFGKTPITEMAKIDLFPLYFCPFVPSAVSQYMYVKTGESFPSTNQWENHRNL